MQVLYRNTFIICYGMNVDIKIYFVNLFKASLYKYVRNLCDSKTWTTFFNISIKINLKNSYSLQNLGHIIIKCLAIYITTKLWKLSSHCQMNCHKIVVIVQSVAEEHRPTKWQLDLICFQGFSRGSSMHTNLTHYLCWYSHISPRNQIKFCTITMSV